MEPSGLVRILVSHRLYYRKIDKTYKLHSIFRKWDGRCNKDWTSVYEQGSEKWAKNISDSM